MFMTIAAKVQERKLTYLSNDKLKSMGLQIQAIKEKKVPGDFVEFGIALGGSGICIASELDGDRRFVGFDVFGMIPPPGERDGRLPQQRYQAITAGQSAGIGGDIYYGYIPDLMNKVTDNFREFGLEVDGDRVFFVPGLYQNTLPGRGNMRIALAHIDCDWFEPVSLCLQYVAPNLSSGGIIILDDYNDWPGCREATDQFLAQSSELHLVTKSPHCILTKV